jgi:DNA-binding MarR family transcriptional regulator
VLYPLSYGRPGWQCSRMDSSRPAGLFLDLWTAARRSVRLVADALADAGIGDVELACLLHLSATPAGQTLTSLAETMGVAFMSVSDAVARLERDGDARRLPHPDDRRALLVQLTPRGARRAADAAQVLDGLARGLARERGLSVADARRLATDLRDVVGVP